MLRCFLLSLVFVIRIASAQNYFPSSADAMGLARLASVPINYFTGSAAVTIPLMQVSGRELSVPIALSYDASGVKVNSIASVVGLQFNLLAGGLITRVVRGEPDDLADGYCLSSQDSEPDLYYFNFLGMSGKFMLDKSGNVITFPYRPIVIKAGICKFGSTGVWEIIDENGVIYRFGKPGSVETTTATTFSTSTSRTYTSSWYLSEVLSPNSTEIVKFSYTTPSVYSTLNHFFVKVKDPCDDKVNDLTTNVATQSIYIRSISVFVNQITDTLAAAYFSYSGSRKDLPGGRMLTSVKMTNKDHEQVVKYRFSYGYFQASDCENAECFRLRLDAVYDLAPDPLHTFVYNTSQNLPSRYSKNFDHWGYYNNNTIDSWIPHAYKEVAAFLLGSSQISFDIPGASREPDEAKGLANILTSIAQRGGSVRTFVYTAHRANVAGTDRTIGGARISSITETDGNGHSYTKSYLYASDEYPNLSSGFQHRRILYIVLWQDQSGFVGQSTHFSHSFNELFDLEGAHIGYGKVQEVVIGAGKTVYYFHANDTYPDPVDAGTSEITDYSAIRGNLKQVKVFGQSGTLLSTRTMNYNFLANSKGSIRWDQNYSRSYSCSGNSGVLQLTYRRLFVSRPILMTKVWNEINDPANSARKLTSVVDNEFDNFAYQLVKSTSYDLNRPSEKYIKEYKFVTNFDYYSPSSCETQYSQCYADCQSEPDSQARDVCMNSCAAARDNCVTNITNQDPVASAIVLLKNRHQINAVVEEMARFDNGASVTTTSSTINVYQVHGSKIYAKEVWSFGGSGTYTPTSVASNGAFVKEPSARLIQSYTGFDEYGNLSQEISFSGMQTTHTYDNSKSQLLSTTITRGDQSRTTSSTYKASVGRLTVTDANGRISRQEFDVYNRPSITKDHSGNILTRTRHHYKGETAGYRLVTNPNRIYGLINESFQFSVADVASSIGGAPRFVWDLGEGTVIDNNSTTVTKNYSTAGTYEVKVAALNPEYGSSAKSVSITISPPLSASICVNGPTTVDLCTGPSRLNPNYGTCTDSGHNTPTSSDVLTISKSNGCPNSISYLWEYQAISGGSWIGLGTSASITINRPFGIFNYVIRCTVTDGCGQVQPTVTLSNFTTCP